jgi:hypothetical protein
MTIHWDALEGEGAGQPSAGHDLVVRRHRDGRLVVQRTGTLDRHEPAARPRHWALVCCSTSPIDARFAGLSFRNDDVRNLGSDARPGGSQVTTTVRYQRDPDATGHVYQVRFRAELVRPYVLRLADPLDVPADLRTLIATGDLAAAEELRRRQC